MSSLSRRRGDPALLRIGPAAVVLCALVAAAAGPPSEQPRAAAVRMFEEAGRAWAEGNTSGYRRAAERYREAARWFALAGDPQAEAQAWLGQGLAALELDDHPAAGVFLGQALERFQMLDDRAGLQAAHTNLGLLASDRGQWRAALGHLQTAVDLARAGHDLAAEARGLTNLGALYTELGAIQAAVDTLETALDRHRANGDLDALAASHNALGIVMTQIGALDDAEPHLRAASDLYRRRGNRASGAEVAINLAIVAWRRGAPKVAEAEATAAAVAHQRRGDSAGEAAARLVLSRVALDTGAHERARAELASALALARRAGDRRLIAAVLRALAAERAAAKEPKAAERAAREGLGLAMAVGDAQGTVDAHMRLARLAHAAGRLADAIHHAEQAARQLEAVAGPVRADRLALSIGAEGHAVFAFLVDVLAGAYREQRDDALVARAFIAAERGRAHALHTILRRNRGADADAVQAMERPVHGRELDHPDRFAAQLNEGELVLAFLLGEEQGHVFALDRHRLTLHALGPVSPIDDAARHWHAMLAAGRRTARGPARVLADTLGALLLVPVAERLAPAKTVLVIADGALHYLPFAALPLPATASDATDGEALGLSRALVTLPSIRAAEVYSRMAALRKPAIEPSAGPTVAAVVIDQPSEGWSALPFARREAERIVALADAGGRLLLAHEAGRHALLAGTLAAYRFVHFATHARIDDLVPARSGLRIGFDAAADTDRFLRLADLEALALSAELVSLGACQTGLGREVSGAGLVGLARGFQAAGVPRVLVSLWDVDDEATAAFMVRFYRGLLAEGLAAPEALRSARRELAAGPRWRAPRYWAAFTLVGDWR